MSAFIFSKIGYLNIGFGKILQRFSHFDTHQICLNSVPGLVVLVFLTAPLLDFRFPNVTVFRILSLIGHVHIYTEFGETFSLKNGWATFEWRRPRKTQSHMFILSVISRSEKRHQPHLPAVNTAWITNNNKCRSPCCL